MVVTPTGYATSWRTRVRVKVNGRWRKGAAYLMLDDDPIARQRELDPFNAWLVRFLGTELTTVRVDLDPEKD